MYCPKCKRFVVEEEHVSGGRIEYQCPHCGHRIRVVHKPMRPERWRDDIRTRR